MILEVAYPIMNHVNTFASPLADVYGSYRTGTKHTILAVFHRRLQSSRDIWYIVQEDLLLKGDG